MGEIMVAATENKRGRPKKINDAWYYSFSELEKRAAQNVFYVAEAIRITNDKPGGFFVTDKGKFRRNGIAEQIGRAFVDGLISEEQGKELKNIVINEYTSGRSVKDIEKDLRIFRQTLQRELNEQGKDGNTWQE